MTKNDLKTGMIIEDAEGDQYYIIKDFNPEGVVEMYNKGYDYSITAISLSKNDFTVINEQFSDTLEFIDRNNRQWDIIKVYIPRTIAEKKELKLLWERPKPKEIKMSLNDIKQKLGLNLADTLLITDK